jgi:polar amino acid transport system substrate-binding protein
MAKGNERLKEVVNKVVKKLKADGTYDEYIKDASKYTAVE